MMKSAGRFDRGVGTRSGNGHAPQWNSKEGKSPMHKDGYRLEKRPALWNSSIRSNGLLDNIEKPGKLNKASFSDCGAEYTETIARNVHMLPESCEQDGKLSRTACEDRTTPMVAISTPDGPSGETAQQKMRAKARSANDANAFGSQPSTVDEYVRIHRKAAGDPETIMKMIRQENLEERLAYFMQLTQSQIDRKRPEPPTEEQQQGVNFDTVDDTTSFDAIDDTKGTSCTISKDSSADEGTRQAKLLADMGEKCFKRCNGNDLGPDGLDAQINLASTRVKVTLREGIRVNNWEGGED